MADNEKNKRDPNRKGKATQKREYPENPDQQDISVNDVVRDDDSSQRGMADENDPHEVEPRERDFMQSKISNKDEDAEADHSDQYFGKKSNNYDEDVERKNRSYHGKHNRSYDEKPKDDPGRKDHKE